MNGMGNDARCPLCGAPWVPGVSRWEAAPALPGCRPARQWRHEQPYRGRRHTRPCHYTDAEPLPDNPYTPPLVNAPQAA